MAELGCTKAGKTLFRNTQIKYGYLLLFRYQGRSSFIVQIFDLSTGQIKYVSSCHQMKVDFVIKEEECDTEDREMDNQPRKFKSGKKSCFIYNKSEVLLQKAKAVRSRNPHFNVTMKPAYVTVGSRITCYMHIPRDAASYFGKKGKDDIQLSLNGRVWFMKYYLAPSPFCSARIGSGWRIFSEENNLQEGDICTFEPVSSTDMKFEVTISRKIDEQVDLVTSPGTKRKRDLSVKEKSNMLLIEKSTAIECNETSFTVTIKKTQVGYFSRLNIPRAHSTRHLHDQNGNEIVLHGVGGKTWPVKCYVYGLDARLI